MWSSTRNWLAFQIEREKRENCVCSPPPTRPRRVVVSIYKTSSAKNMLGRFWVGFLTLLGPRYVTDFIAGRKMFPSNLFGFSCLTNQSFHPSSFLLWNSQTRMFRIAKSMKRHSKKILFLVIISPKIFLAVIPWIFEMLSLL